MTITNRSHRSIFAGMLGAVAFAGGLAAVSINASADAPALVTPYDEAATTTTVAGAATTQAPADVDLVSIDEMTHEDEAWVAFDECMAETGVYDEIGYDELEEEDYEAMDAAYDAAYEECSLLLPESVRIENAAWEAYHECVDEAVGPTFWEDENWDDEAYTAAERGCRSVLPEEMQQEMAAYDAYDDCYAEFAVDLPYNGSVSVDSMETYESFAFGDDDATITITKVDGEVTVTVDGDVVVQDDAYWKAQEIRWQEADAACGHLLPEYD